MQKDIKESMDTIELINEVSAKNEPVDAFTIHHNADFDEMQLGEEIVPNIFIG